METTFPVILETTFPVEPDTTVKEKVTTAHAEPDTTVKEKVTTAHAELENPQDTSRQENTKQTYWRHTTHICFSGRTTKIEGGLKWQYAGETFFHR